jgi:AcrR family transcriptional regulator
MSTKPPNATPGRTARSRETILQAALDLCAERGYATTTMEAVAARAKVGKPTIYRWWPSKGVLVFEALMNQIGERFFVYPDTGDIEADLLGWLRNLTELFTDPKHGPMVAGVVGAAQHDPELATIVHQQVHLTLEARNQARIIKAQEAGQLTTHDASLFNDMLIAPLWYRLLITGQPITPDYADRIVATLLRPLSAQSSANTAATHTTTDRS